MSDAAAGAGGWSPERSAAGGRNPYLIAVVVSIATFMEVLDTTIANVALRHIAGGLAVGIDESTYVITSYLVANAIVLAISGWLSTVIGRKRFYMICVGIFTVASLLCGFAWSLESLVLFRILQGLGGGGMATSEQAILADSFPPEKRGQAFAVYGIAVVVAPVVGPTLGGWITDTYSWHWVFLINVPMGLISLFLVGTLVSEPSGAEEERKALLKKGLRVDYIGFALVAIGLGSLEFVLLAGLALSPGGIATLCMMPIVGRLIGVVQPKYLLVFGATVVAGAMWHLTGLNGNITYGYAAYSRIFLAIGLPFLFLPVTTASYDGIPPDKTNQASALINVARNIGGSMGVALAQTMLAQRQQFHQSRLVEQAAPSDVGYQRTLEQVTRYFLDHGSNQADASGRAIGWIAQTIQRQVDLLAYIDVFWSLSIVGLIMIPIALSIKPINLAAPPKGH
jgi:MFS family permease